MRNYLVIIGILFIIVSLSILSVQHKKWKEIAKVQVHVTVEIEEEPSYGEGIFYKYVNYYAHRPGIYPFIDTELVKSDTTKMKRRYL